MRHVLGASVGLKWELPEPDSDRAERLREGYRNGVHELIAPEPFALEIAHGLTKAERQGRISDATAPWLDAMTTCPDLVPFGPLMYRALQIASRARIGVYDCLYVALAEREGCELITADERLVRALRPAFPFLMSLSAFP